MHHQKIIKVPEKHLLLLYWPHQSFYCVDHHSLWKTFQEMGIPDHLTCLLRNLYGGQELDMEQQTGSKLGKEYAKALYVKKYGLKLNIQKTNITESGPILSWQIDRETIESDTLYFWGLQNYCKWWLQPWY